MSKTSTRLLAGSVETISTRRPASARAIAVAAAQDVLPTPPLPVKNKNGVGSRRIPASTPGSATCSVTDVAGTTSAAARAAAAPASHRQRGPDLQQGSCLDAGPHRQLGARGNDPWTSEH